MISNICVFLVIASIIATPILLIVSLLKRIRKKPVKKTLVSALFSFCMIFVFSLIGGLATMPDSSNDGVVEADSITQENNDSQQTEETNECEHVWIETSRDEPTEERQGVSYQECEICEETRRWFIPKIEHVVTFDEIYREYKSNELRADEKYKNNRYTITATINGMTTDGLLNWSGGATLTMETRVDDTIVFFYASFEKEQEEALKSVNVGDEITFEGECLSAGTWIECELTDLR